MGEKPINFFLDLMRGFQDGDISIESANIDRLKIVLKNQYNNREAINLFLNILENVVDQQIRAYSRENSQNQCELYIHL